MWRTRDLLLEALANQEVVRVSDLLLDLWLAVDADEEETAEVLALADNETQEALEGAPA